jgi:hypothetical protein
VGGPQDPLLQGWWCTPTTQHGLAASMLHADRQHVHAANHEPSTGLPASTSRQQGTGRNNLRLRPPQNKRTINTGWCLSTTFVQEESAVGDRDTNKNKETKMHECAPVALCVCYAPYVPA